MTFVEQRAKNIKKYVARNWGAGWNLLSERQQLRELAYEYANVVLAQVQVTPEVKELQDLARELLREKE